MQTNNHKIFDYDAVLDAKFGKEGAPERIQAEEAAYSFYDDITKTAHYKKAMDDVKNGRVYHCDSVDDLFKELDINV